MTIAVYLMENYLNNFFPIMNWRNFDVKKMLNIIPLPRVMGLESTL